ncbi:MAG: uracil-DNA glycosylase [Syntrophomonadaceae bacterium]|nr:uracil-DNA glycosylase [Syntrophomonadaceae bacterium]
MPKRTAGPAVGEQKAGFAFKPIPAAPLGERLLSSRKYTHLKSLAELQAICLNCTECGLAAGRTKVVFGEGNPQAKILLVGEGPGKTEDQTGRPFVGQAGQLLDRILASVGLKREEVFIANVVKCRPPGNRLPTPEESLACRPYLDAQIFLINPLIIICLGALATQTLIDPKGRITTLRGQWVKKEGYWLIPTYHPAALLRDPNKKRPVWEDFKEIRRRYDLLTSS